MGFLKTGSTEMQVYLTEYGKQKMLEQSFHPMQFTLNDSDVNYLTNMTMSKAVVDVSGDYDDNVFSLSKWQNIRGSIIRNVAAVNTTGVIVTSTEVNVSATTDGTTVS